MPIANHGCVPFIGYSVDDKIVFSSSSLTKLDLFSDRHYWIVEFEHASAIDNLEKFISEDIISAVRSGELTLLLTNTYEGEYSAIESIYKKVITDWAIPEQNVVIVSEGADINVKVSEFATAIGRQPIESWWSRIFEYQAGTQAVWERPDQIPTTLLFKNYDKKFLCFNRAPRPHRTGLIALLQIKQLLDRGYVSTSNLSWADCYHKLMAERPELENDKMGELLRLHNAQNFDIKQQILDIELDEKIAQPEIYHTQNSKTDEFYKNTYFSVVTETRSSNGQCRVLSEKTFKPIANNHPFILVTVPHVLKLLQELGYRTFNGIIDESYDSETNDSTRLLMIVDEIQRLSNLNDEQLFVFLEKAREICKHNYNHLLSLKNSSSFMTKTNRIF